MEHEKEKHQDLHQHCDRGDLGPAFGKSQLVTTAGGSENSSDGDGEEQSSLPERRSYHHRPAPDSAAGHRLGVAGLPDPEADPARRRQAGRAGADRHQPDRGASEIPGGDRRRGLGSGHPGCEHHRGAGRRWHRGPDPGLRRPEPDRGYHHRRLHHL